MSDQPGSKRPILAAYAVTKGFPGVKALNDVDFELFGGSVHALIGENGAGKSTLMKVLGGVHRPDRGRIERSGKVVNIPTPLAAQHLGISVIHQELNLMPDLTVAENVFFGREPRKGPLLDDRTLNRKTAELMDRLRLRIDPRQKVGRLTVASQQMVEIAKALSFDSKILIMDEPTAALTETEVDTLFGVIRDFVGPDSAVVYVSHRMAEIKQIADTVTVLRDGNYISTDPAEELSIGAMIHKMVGRDIPDDIRPDTDTHDADVVLRVDSLSTKELLRDVSFELRRGEVLGFAGLMGAGRTETARAVVGADPSTSGRIEVGGRRVRIASPADAVARGIGYLSEDRKRYGLLLDKDLVANVGLPSFKTWSNLFGTIRDARAAEVTARYVKSLRVRTPSIHQLLRNLSGGNQQKVVVAKWLARDCDILIFDEPTRGIDVGAKEEIYHLLKGLAEEGKSIIVISSEITEVLRLCERIVVMCDGRVTGELSNAEATQDKIMALATQFATTDTVKEAS